MASAGVYLVEDDLWQCDNNYKQPLQELFVARLLTHPEFAGKIRAMVQPAFSEVMRTISAKKGSVLDRAALEAVLQSSVLGDLTQEKSVTVWIHSWDKGSFRACGGLRTGLVVGIRPAITE